MSSSSTLPSRSNLPGSVLVIGGSLAGLRTVASLRERGFSGDITVVTDDALSPYDRPPLSKKLFTNDAPVFLAQDLGFDVDELATRVLYSTRATALAEGPDGTGWVVSLGVVADGGDSGVDGSALIGADRSPVVQSIYADVVVLAVGSTPIVPREWSGVFSLHSWEDATALREQLSSSGHLVIVGAGWIGSEVAAVAAQAGHQVTVLEAGDTPLAMQVGTVVGSRISPWFEQANVRLELGARVTNVFDDGHRVVFADQSGASHELHADVVLAAIGARPHTAWLVPTLELAGNGAVPTNEWGQVLVTVNDAVADSAPAARAGLYAVGDCALRRDAALGLVPGGHWNTALADPDRIAGHIVENQERDVAGSEVHNAPASGTPHVFSTQFGRDVNLFGTPDLARDEVLFREPSGRGWTALYVRTESGRTQLTGVFTVDAPRDATQARRILAAGPVGIDVTRALDPGTPLKSAVS